MARMAATSSRSAQCCQEGVVALATKAMERFPKQKRLLVAGAMVLDAVFCPEILPEMEESSLVSTCVDALVHHGTNPDMVRVMCPLLQKLVTEKTYPQLKSKKALSVLMDCLLVHLQDQDRCADLLRLIVDVLFMNVKQGERCRSASWRWR